MSRIWNLRLNLDEFNSLVGMAFTDADKAAVLNGLMAGLNGAQLPEQCSNGLRVAFETGSRWRQEAEGYSVSQSIAGKASAEARKKKFGSAQPSSGVRTSLEQASNLTTIHNPICTSTPKPPRSSRKKEEIPPIPGDLLPFLETLTSDWPRKSHDGRRVTVLRPVDSWDKICKNRGTDDPRVCINAGLAYLDLHPTEYVIGMDNFFGKDRKYTKFVVEE